MEFDAFDALTPEQIESLPPNERAALEELRAMAPDERVRFLGHVRLTITAWSFLESAGTDQRVAARVDNVGVLAKQPVQDAARLREPSFGRLPERQVKMVHGRLNRECAKQRVHGHDLTLGGDQVVFGRLATCDQHSGGVSTYNAAIGSTLDQALAMILVPRRPTSAPGVPGCHCLQ